MDALDRRSPGGFRIRLLPVYRLRCAMRGAVVCVARVASTSALSALAATAFAADVDAGRSTSPPRDSADWPMHGRTPDEQRFSPLAQIDVSNAGELGLAWYFDLDTSRGQEATPLVIDGVMYVTSAWSRVFALDAKTGKELWRYDPQVPGEWAINACCDVVNRGLAAWEGKLFLGTLDGRLVALEAATGKVLWEVLTIDPGKPYTITGAPRVIKGKVIIGNGGAELGVRGYVSAYDADTGRLAWRFYTVPGAPGARDGAASDEVLERLARPTWAGRWWELGGGGTVWDAMAFDPELDLLYVGVGNGSPWNHQIRSQGRGDNLFLASIVALRPDTGQYVWHFQTTPGETWDFTATQHMILADLEIEGRLRKVLMQAPKNGFFYVLDRATGELISGAAFAPVNWAYGLDARGRPIENPAARYARTGRPWVNRPGPAGAHNWYPMSFDPASGLVFIPVQDMPSLYVHDRHFTPKMHAWRTGIDPLPLDVELDDASRALLDAEPRGALLAWDPVRQRAAWRVEHASVANGGTLATAGGLVFQGTSDGYFRAFAIADGAQLWSYDVQDAILGGPVSYEIDGVQYVAAVAGLGGTTPLVSGRLFTERPRARHGRVLAFRLGGMEKLPPLEPLERRKLDVSGAEAEGSVLEGARLYNAFCLTCHGTGAHSGPTMPDLRRSPAILDAKTFEAIVLGGALAPRGMASFRGSLDAAQLEALRAYLLFEAIEPDRQRPMPGLRPDRASRNRRRRHHRRTTLPRARCASPCTPFRGAPPPARSLGRRSAAVDHRASSCRPPR